MAENSWYPFEDGVTLGQKGSEDGVILRDEEHPLEARITLERDTPSVPFAITCGIYGCMLHTRFFSLESEACSQYDLMKDALSALLFTENEGGPEGRSSFLDGVAAFVETYP
ncbi:MAG: hypothetical protein ABSE55_03220 [Terracidiphilus sp.]|jgi:hypothetical protein